MSKNREYNSPLIARSILRLLLNPENAHRINEYEEIYDFIRRTEGKRLADKWYRLHIIKSAPFTFYNQIISGGDMFKNYLLIALRTIKKNKFYSGINITGLALGISCSLLIYMYVTEELSFDNYHGDVKQIFRVYEEISSPTSVKSYPSVAFPVAPTLLKDYPQVEYAARLYTHISTRLIKFNDKAFYEPGFIYGEEDIFKILSFNFIQGNPNNALTRTNTIVITKSIAEKYFGRINPVGKVLLSNGAEYEVTGVIDDLPYNTHLKFDLIASLKTLEDENWWSNWFGTETFTYIKLSPNVDGTTFGEQINTFADKYIDESVRQRGKFHRFYLQNVSDIHLKSNLVGELEPPGNFYTIILFSAIGLFVLIIACLNYMNLSTAKSLNRAKEIGLRKVVGGNRKQIAVQFYTESILISFIALLAAFAITISILPYFNYLSGTAFSQSDMFNPGILTGLLALGLIVGLGAGSYPASFLSSFNPVATLGGSFKRGKKGSLMRKSMVIFQFAISLLLIIGTIVIHRQIIFMQNQNLGFNKKQKLIIPVQGGASIRSNYVHVKEILKSNPDIVSVTASSNVPGVEFYSWNLTSLDSKHEFENGVNHLFVDPDFFNSYKIKMAAGRNFNNLNPADISDWSKYTHFIINEAAADVLGFSNPNDAIGLKIKSGLGAIHGEIIGVTKNFHYAGLQTAVEPLVMSWFPTRFCYITMNVKTSNINNTVDFAEEKWAELFPGSLMEYNFLDEEFNALYNSEKQTAGIANAFTFIGLFIACLGLLGLVSFIAEQRKKEIGIRKVLGSSVPALLLMLFKEFLIWIVLSNIIAWPVAYLLMKSWLNDFAYRIDIGVDVFFYAGFISVMLMFVTVGYQSIKAALANPIDSIKYE